MTNPPYFRRITCKNEPTIQQQRDNAYLCKELLHICLHSNNVSLHPVGKKSQIHSNTRYNYKKIIALVHQTH